MGMKGLLRKRMTDDFLLQHGYVKYNPTPFDNKLVVARFQKRFDDEYGKKYFIDVLKWSNEFIPVNTRDKQWQPFIYCYKTQITMFECQKALYF